MLAAVSASVTGGQEIKLLTVRLGTLAAVAYGFLAWLGTRPAPLQAPAEPAVAAPAIAGSHSGRHHPGGTDLAEQHGSRRESGETCEIRVILRETRSPFTHDGARPDADPARRLA